MNEKEKFPASGSKRAFEDLISPAAAQALGQVAIEPKIEQTPAPDLPQD